MLSIFYSFNLHTKVVTQFMCSELIIEESQKVNSEDSTTQDMGLQGLSAKVRNQHPAKSHVT